MEDIENIKAAGLKMTPQRIAVYRTMMTLRHAKLEQIVESLKAEYSNLTLSTVYRVLESFCKAGVLSLVCHPETGECYYDITVKNHHHLFNGSEIVDYRDEELTSLVREFIQTKRPDLKDIEKIQVQITIK
ncbi:MAG: transcriptional repressor [Bacteroidaceae bacterium]|mgnify:CR=1 FL=1|nr:transcriptional repressor [Bacteroidaceae bacterium]